MIAGVVVESGMEVGGVRLLLAVDTVVTTEMILEAVESRPWPRGTRARVLSAVEDGAVPAEAWRGTGYGAGAVRQEMRRRGEQLTALAVERLARLGIEAEVSIMRGEPAWLIALAARKWKADLILIRAHNRADFRNWVLGSVAKAVVRDAPCSVEVVRPAKDDLSAARGGRMKIILATDGSEQSAAAARAVAARPWPVGTEVKVLGTVNPLAYSAGGRGLVDGGVSQRARRAITDAAQLLEAAGLRTTGELVVGRAGTRIVGEATGWGADLVVVGTRERKGLRRLLSGSVSETVAASAPCSVIVVRARRDDARRGRLQPDARRGREVARWLSARG